MEAPNPLKNDVYNDYARRPIKDSSAEETVFVNQTTHYEGYTSATYPSFSKRLWDFLQRDRLVILFGCIDYQFPAEPGHHQSRFAFGVGKLINQGDLERFGGLPDDPTTVDLRFKTVNISDDQPPD